MTSIHVANVGAMSTSWRRDSRGLGPPLLSTCADLAGRSSNAGYVSLPVCTRLRDLPIGDLNLLEALRHLPARQREAVVLYYLADQSVDDCAGLMAVPAGAVKRHLSRAREHLARDPAILPLEGTT